MNNALKEFRPESLCLLKESLSQDDYWCFARRAPQDFSIYTEKSSIYELPCKEKFRESADVLVRWTDGLLYLATIIQVEEEYNRCAVKFEDGSQFWALFKDIYKGPVPDNEFACTVCDTNSSQPPDEIVICDKCSSGYHQLCHIPKIESGDLNPEIPWSCRKCVFAAAAKKGGAIKKGHHAQAMLQMKQTLPYDIHSLTWDSSHRSNLQQIYCYCGGPGEWFSKMLQCNRCKQWFHEACLQCLDEPLLLGDRFYVFICSVCNKGPEFLRRLSLRWADIAHLVLFNLAIMHGKKFFQFESSIMAFLKENWPQFQLKGEVMGRISPEEKRKNMLENLHCSKSRFTSGKDMKKKSTIWGLKTRVPPPVPFIPLPSSGVITDAVFDAFSPSNRKSKLSFLSLPIKRQRKLSSETDQSKLSNDTDQSKFSDTSEQSKVSESSSTSSSRSSRVQLRKRKSRPKETTRSDPAMLKRLRVREKTPAPESVASSSESSSANVVTKKLRLRRPSARESDVASSETSSKSVSKSDRSREDKNQKEQQKKVKRRVPRHLLKMQGLKLKKVRCASHLRDQFEDTSARDILNSFIPPSTKFSASNNPFLSTYTLSCYADTIQPDEDSDQTSENSGKTVRLRPSRKFGCKVAQPLSDQKKDVVQPLSDLKKDVAQSLRDQKKDVAQSLKDQKKDVVCESNSGHAKSGKHKIKSVKAVVNGSSGKSEVVESVKMSEPSNHRLNSKKDEMLKSVEKVSQQSNSKKLSKMSKVAETPSQPSNIKKDRLGRLLEINMTDEQTKIKVKPPEAIGGHVLRVRKPETKDSEKEDPQAKEEAAKVTLSTKKDTSSLVSETDSGEKYTVLAKRIGEDGKVQYLVEWDS